MRISDWSSDGALPISSVGAAITGAGVCDRSIAIGAAKSGGRAGAFPAGGVATLASAEVIAGSATSGVAGSTIAGWRKAERRAGKVRGSTGNTRWRPYEYTQHNEKHRSISKS